MAEREYDPNYNPYGSGQIEGREREYDNTPVPGLPAPMPDNYIAPEIEEASRRYNGGSPPAVPLQPGYGWEWNGWDWVQVEGRGIGYKAVEQTTTRDGGGGGGGSNFSGGGGGNTVAGVPPAWDYKASTLGGSVPGLDEPVAGAKKLPQAPQFSPYAAFEPPQAVGLEARNNLINAILARPQTMDQQFQDSMFEQQKEQQIQLANQAKQRMNQAGASRWFHGGGGFTARALGGVEGDFTNNLLAARRDVSMKAAEVNRQNELAALDMQEAVSKGDYARAQAAYDTQLKAKAMYDELRMKAAEFDRANIALAAQTNMAGRQQQMAEQVASFQQYLDQLKFEEMMRQFNNQMALDWSKYGWGQQMDLANQFPRNS